MQPVPALLHTRRRGAILLLALLAFMVGQAFAVAHASWHAAGDANVPASDARLCGDCASTLPLLAVAGDGGAAPALATPAQQVLLPAVTAAVVPAGPHRSFLARAPPR